MERAVPKFTRKEFLKGSAALAAAAALKMLFPDLVRADSNPDLTMYLNQVDPLKMSLRPIVEANDLFAGFKPLNALQRLRDFDMYFPMYCAGEIQYSIPWFMLWIIHTHETAVSRDPTPDKEGYAGAMQRSLAFYGDLKVQAASAGWEMLDDLEQRYTKKKGFLTNDYSEILFAAWKIRQDADGIISLNSDITFENAFLKAQYSYCAAAFAAQRIKRYEIFKKAFAQASTPDNPAAF